MEGEICTKVIFERTKITHVAIRFRGKVYSLPAPNRHHHVIWEIVRQIGVDYVDAHDDDQGFLDEAGNYLTRQQALVSAQMFNQMKPDRPIWNDGLYSENVW